MTSRHVTSLTKRRVLII